MPKSDAIEKWERRKNFHVEWETGLCGAPCRSPFCCCVSFLCPCCASYRLRYRALHGDMKRYRCCGNYFYCSGKMLEQNCPELCLGLETCCCFPTSVVATRWLIQDELNIRNSRCDNCLLWTAICCSYLDCCCQLAAMASGAESVGEAADLISFISDVIWCSICPCIQAQHNVQMNERDKIRDFGDDRDETAPIVPSSGSQTYLQGGSAVPTQTMHK